MYDNLKLKQILFEVEVEDQVIYTDFSEIPLDNEDNIFLFFVDKSNFTAMYNSFSEKNKTIERINLVNNGFLEFLGAVKLNNAEADISFIMSEIIHETFKD